MEKARATVPGKILDVTLDELSDPPSYRVKVLTDAGVVKTVLIDATTGEGIQP